MNANAYVKLADRWISVILILISTALLLTQTSPEFSWDEADYLSALSKDWKSLWATGEYARHHHGPLSIYLAKLGYQLFPDSLMPVEYQTRFFISLTGSLAVGFLYLLLRQAFGCSRAAAFVGCFFLLFSVIRVAETNVIGPHHLMLVCTLLLVGLGYRWRDQPTFAHAAGLGLVIAFGAISMTYIIPAVVGWGVAVTLAGRGWTAWDWKHFKFSWSLGVLGITAAIVLLALGPPAILQKLMIRDFKFHLHFPYHTTLVGDQIYEITPRWAAFYWFGTLEFPLFLVSALVIPVALVRSIRSNQLSSKHFFVIICLLFFAWIALKAHLAGSRNLIQLVGVLSLATGALFDDAFANKIRWRNLAAGAVVVVTAVNFIFVTRFAGCTPYLATDGYRAFIGENKERLKEDVTALVYGLPIVKIYSDLAAAGIDWNVTDIPWTTAADAPLADDVKYVLMPAFYDEHMPAHQPFRKVVAKEWNTVWVHRSSRAWELRLYERPASPSPRSN